jgi:UDP-glucose 4-epimerase
MKEIAVTGAGGWVGQAVCLWLEQHRIPVRRLVRRPAGSGERPFDLAQPSAAWSEALRGCRAVVHCAAHVHRPVETERERELFRLINGEGTRRLAEAAAAAGVERLVLASSVAVYAWGADGRSRNEEAAVGGSSAYAASKHEAETAVLAFRGTRCVARLATVYGRGDRANFARLARALRRRRFFIPGDGRARKSVIEINRAGEVLARLAAGAEAPPEVVNVAAPHAPALREICAAFSLRCGFPAAPSVPLGLLRWAAKAGDGVQAVWPGVPLSTKVLTKLTGDTVVDTARLAAVFRDLEWRDFGETLRDSASYYGSL